MTWAGMVRSTNKKQYSELMNNPRILNAEDSAYINNISSLRAVSGLAPLEYKIVKPADFSGEWVFNEDKSQLDNFGAGMIPERMKITQKRDSLIIQKTFVQEYTDDRITVENLALDGSESHSEMYNSPRIMKASWTGKSDTLKIVSQVTIRWSGSPSTMTIDEAWNLSAPDKLLIINQTSNSFMGKRNITMVYEKK